MRNNEHFSFAVPIILWGKWVIHNTNYGTSFTPRTTFLWYERALYSYTFEKTSLFNFIICNIVHSFCYMQQYSYLLWLDYLEYAFRIKQKQNSWYTLPGHALAWKNLRVSTVVPVKAFAMILIKTWFNWHQHKPIKPEHFQIRLKWVMKSTCHHKASGRQKLKACPIVLCSGTLSQVYDLTLSASYSKVRDVFCCLSSFICVSFCSSWTSSSFSNSSLHSRNSRSSCWTSSFLNRSVVVKEKRKKHGPR